MANSEKQTPPPIAVTEDKPRRPERPVNPFIRLVVNRLFLIGTLIVVIVVGFGSCALFAPTFFALTIKAVQSAGLNVYTVVLGITGNPALQVISYESDVSAKASVSRDLGLLTLLYGESADIIGTVHVSLGADLKNKQFGVLNCDLDVNTVRVSEKHQGLSSSAFDPQKIKQQASAALETQAAALAVKTYWPLARQGLTGQFVSWALGVTVPETPTLTDCPFNVLAAAAAIPAATQAP